MPAAGVVDENEPNCGLACPKDEDGVPKMPVLAAGCWVIVPNIDVLVAGAPKPKPGVVEAVGWPNVVPVPPNRLPGCWVVLPKRLPLVLGAEVAPNAEVPKALPVCPKGAGCVDPKVVPEPNPVVVPKGF